MNWFSDTSWLVLKEVVHSSVETQTVAHDFEIIAVPVVKILGGVHKSYIYIGTPQALPDRPISYCDALPDWLIECHWYMRKSYAKDRLYVHSVPVRAMRASMQLADLLVRFVKRGKVDWVVVANVDGDIVAKTPTCDATDVDVGAVLKAAHSNYTAMAKMKFCGDIFTCFHHDDNGTIVGRADDKVLVAHRSHQYFIIGLSHVEVPGSCIYEVTEFGKHIQKKGL